MPQDDRVAGVGGELGGGAAALPPPTARLLELQAQANALRATLFSLEASIAEEEALLSASPDTGVGPNEDGPTLLHHRPSWSILGGKESSGEGARPFIRLLSPSDEEFDRTVKSFPEMLVSDIAKFNDWDRRECAVSNVKDWRDCCDKYMREVLKGQADIPKVIHQVWIGPKEPPCLWLDTFRVEYLAAYREWGYTMWSDEEVAKLPMFNADMYAEEKMWQCKADILRLEILWHHGGLYVDADMISVDNKCLDQVLELGRLTGFVIAYEPDTKDKPYSVLGNSVIACTAHHPLIMMLILYLKATYKHKRPYRPDRDVFIITGPVMYTKCLVDTQMPISLAAQELLYPKFHFVPNPDAIDLSSCPKCLMFQFGYTCSGLEGYVKSKNKCKKARTCPFHSKKEWPLGAFRDLPTVAVVEERFAASVDKSIPKVIHQLILGDVDGPGDPVRWRRSWWEDFMRAHPGFQYRAWTLKDLRGRKWFCANLFVEPWDDQAVTALMLEVLFDEGGYYVPLSSTFRGGGEDKFWQAGGADGNLLEGCGGVCGAAKGSPGCFRKLTDIYEKGQVEPMAQPSPTGPQVNVMGFRDGSLSRVRFSAETKYLGAGQIVVAVGDARLEQACIGWAYQCQVPVLSARGPEGIKAAVAGSSSPTATRAMFVTDREFFQMDRLRLELPGYIDRLDGQWDLMMFGVEWQTGSEEMVIFQLPPGGRPRNCKVVGFVANFAAAPNKLMLRSTLTKAFAGGAFDPSTLFDAADKLWLWFTAEKYTGSIEEARIFRSMPLVHRAFRQVADHHAPMEYDHQEIHGNLIKGFLHGQLRFEMIMEPNGGTMFRAWNDDNSTNCEMKATDTSVEWMKIYYNHQVAREEKNVSLL